MISGTLLMQALVVVYVVGVDTVGLSRWFLVPRLMPVPGFTRRAEDGQIGPAWPPGVATAETETLFNGFGGHGWVSWLGEQVPVELAC